MIQTITTKTKDDQMGAIANKKKPIVITHEAVQKVDKLYICAVLKNSKKQFNVIDISNIKTMVVDTKYNLTFLMRSKNEL